MVKTTSNILYMRASIGPIARYLKTEGGIINYLSKTLAFNEIFVPYFYQNRFIWSKKKENRKTNSGALGKLVANVDGATISKHPTHSFAGKGERVTKVLNIHDETKPCFFPIIELSEKYDFSMLLLGCVDSSPGFSTVHATQYQLGLSQQHWVRFFMRWDFIKNGNLTSKIPIEFPGCSSSFHKFYELYYKSGNFSQGTIDNVPFLFVRSAREAMRIESEILRHSPRFITCKKSFCISCRMRTY